MVLGSAATTKAKRGELVTGEVDFSLCLLLLSIILDSEEGSDKKSIHQPSGHGEKSCTAAQQMISQIEEASNRLTKKLLNKESGRGMMCARSLCKKKTS